MLLSTGEQKCEKEALKNDCSLVVLNYCMDSSHPSLAHQISIVIRLASKFDHVIVITTSYSGEELPDNVHVKKISWRSRSHLRNAFNLFLEFLKVYWKWRPNYTFSHMAPLSSIVVAPLTRLFKIPHALWYAHAQKTKLLILAVSLVDVVLSSTRGSFPLETRKLTLIGQGVDSSIFARQSHAKVSKFNFLYAGRMDASKNIESIVNVLAKLKSKYPEICLTLIGNGSSLIAKSFKKEWISTKDSVKHNLLPREFEKHGTFIHAFIGSLDKVLVEAVMMKVPVISTNPEFISGFHSYSASMTDTCLESQINHYLHLDDRALNLIVERNYQIAINYHEMGKWIERLSRTIVMS
jgi:glycosyltransferase involved in cell wall biosynthesis